MLGLSQISPEISLQPCQGSSGRVVIHHPSSVVAGLVSPGILPEALVAMNKEGNISLLTGEKGELALCIVAGVDGDLSSPLGIYPPVALDWARHRVKDICLIVGITYVGCEEQTLALLTAIEENHRWEALASLSNFKDSRELRNLECYINYDAKGESSSCGKGKVHVF